MSTLRSAIIRLAATMPKGSEEQKALLDVLSEKTAATRDLIFGWDSKAAFFDHDEMERQINRDLPGFKFFDFEGRPTVKIQGRTPTVSFPVTLEKGEMKLRATIEVTVESLEDGIGITWRVLGRKIPTELLT